MEKTKRREEKLIKTILNRCYKFKSFVYGKVCFSSDIKSKIIQIEIKPRKNNLPICSKCHKPSPIYDKSKKPRHFEFIPIWGYAIFFIYIMRRVNCKSCGIKTEDVPWAKGKCELTKVYMQYLATLAKCLSWKEVAIRFKTSWEKVFNSVEYIVEWGLKHRSTEGITAIGVDEVQWKKGHKYLTLVYQINNNCVRLLWIGQKRTEESFSHFFKSLGSSKCNLIEYVCSDMWKPYLNVIKKKIPQAIHILDRFHIVMRLNKALDAVRADEHKQLKRDGYEPILTKSRWTLLKKPKNLKKEQKIKLKELLKYNLKSMRAYLLKEEFQKLWIYNSTIWASKFLDAWTKKVMLSKIDPMKKEALTIRRHKGLILNWFIAKKQFSSGIVEGLNTKVKLTTRKSYGFKQFKSIEVALYHSLGKLPEPPITHRFY